MFKFDFRSTREYIPIFHIYIQPEKNVHSLTSVDKKIKKDWHKVCQWKKSTKYDGKQGALTQKVNQRAATMKYYEEEAHSEK